VIRVFTYFILGLPLDRKSIGEILLHKHKATEPRNRWRRGPASTIPRGLERGRKEGFNLHCATVVLLMDCSLACSLREKVPSCALSLRRAYNAPLQSAVHLPSTLSTKTAKSCHISVFLMQFGSVDKASSILFSIFSDCTLGSALFAFAVFIAISDEPFSSGFLPSLEWLSRSYTTPRQRTDLRSSNRRH
jgi:hypothetical protein